MPASSITDPMLSPSVGATQTALESSNATVVGVASIVGEGVGEGIETFGEMVVEVGTGVAVVVAVAVPKATCVGLSGAAGFGVGSGCVHAANNTTAKARRTIQCDPNPIVSIVATPELKRKPRFTSGFELSYWHMKFVWNLHLDDGD